MIHNGKQKLEPGDPGYLAWRQQQAMFRRRHAALVQAIDERELSPGDIRYRRLKRWLAEAKRQRW